ncbi:MAG: TonB-dependent receptor [Opitutaceae bacterium]|nr:TonB-dependent receptor [Opitutaceae bacterium]
MRSTIRLLNRLLVGLLLTAFTASATPVKFNIPAQPATDAMLLFSKQSGMDVLYRADDLAKVRTNEVVGEFEPDDAIGRLLQGTGFTARRNSAGKFVVTRIAPAARASVQGTLFNPNGRPASGVTVQVWETGQSILTDRNGDYLLEDVPGGTYTLVATAPGYQPLHITGVHVRSGHNISIAGQVMRRVGPNDDITNLDPFVLQADAVTEMAPFEVADGRAKPFASANVDLPRTVDDVQPYYIFDAKTLDRVGVVNLQDFLRRNLPMDATAVSGQQQVFLGGSGSVVNLRGLGANQTVILVNGRRNATYFFAGVGSGSQAQPDVNGISIAAIERIEVLPTSASAIYGASAVGGVINIVLKRNYSGGEIRSSYQTPFDTDAPIKKVDLTYGLSMRGGKTQLMLSGSWSDTSNLLYQDRPVLADYDRQTYANLGGPTSLFNSVFFGALPNIRSSIGTNLTLKPAYGGGALNSTVTYVPAGTTLGTSPAALGAGLLANAGKFDMSLSDGVQSKALRSNIGQALVDRSFLASLRHEVTPALELNFEFGYTGRRSSRESINTATTSIPASSPINPFNQTVIVTLPFPSGTDSPVMSNNQSKRIGAGFLLKLPHEWQLQGDYTRSETSTYYFTKAFLNNSSFPTTFATGAQNPFVDVRLAPLKLFSLINSRSGGGRSGLDDVSLRAAGPLWHWKAGAITAAAGLQRRQEGFDDSLGQERNAESNTLVSATHYLGKKQVTTGAYLEFLIPLLGEERTWPLIKKLDLQFAGRSEDYKVNTGTASIPEFPVPTTPPNILNNKATFRSTQPTAGFRLQTLAGLTFRASYSGGFLPPTYSQLLLNSALSTNTTNVSDPKRGRQSTPVRTMSGGNPNLVPEVSDSWNAGIVWQPERIKGLRLSVDWYRIEKDNNIGTVNAQQMVDLEDVYPDRVTRGPVIPGDPSGVGPITTVNLSNLNLLKSINEGFDISLNYRRPTKRFGNFEFMTIGSYTEHYQRRITYGQPLIEFANYTSSGPLKLRHTSSLIWDYHSWSLGWSTYYYNRFKIPGPPVTSNPFLIMSKGADTVERQVYHDCSLTYRFGLRDRISRDSRFARGLNRLLFGLEIQAMVINVFNDVPPMDPGSFTVLNYSTWGDIRLREFRIAIKKPL